ncbi:MAG TPA: hypothetical protein VGK48_24255 [Terriglobia bacterium]|jgi:type II secretory pathway component PulM
MKTTSWNLIVLPPNSPRVGQLRFSCKAGVILLAAGILAFLMTVFLLLMYPRLNVNESSRSRLETENQTLRIENENATFKIRRLDADLTRMEAQSKVVEELMTKDEGD